MDLLLTALLLSREEDKYIINEHGVVLDPLTVFSAKLDKTLFDTMYINIAKLSTGYASASCASHSKGGYSGPVSARFGVHKTLLEAIRYEVTRIKKFYTNEAHHPKAKKAIEVFEQTQMEDERYLSSIESRLLFRSASGERDRPRPIHL